MTNAPNSAIQVLEGNNNVWYSDSTGTAQNITLSSPAEAHALWVKLWAQLGVDALNRYTTTAANMPPIGPVWPQDAVGRYEVAAAELDAIRNPPPFDPGTNLTTDSTHAWLLDATGTLQEVTFDTAAQYRTCLDAAWLEMEGVSDQETVNGPVVGVGDGIPFPERAGTYEYVLSVQAGLRNA